MMTDKKHNELLLNVILAALKGYLEGNEGNHDPEDNILWGEVKSNFPYLLGQAIRQWRIPNENWHISNAADIVWKILTNEPIGKKGYQEPFTCQASAIGKVIPTFAGTNKKYGKMKTITINYGTRTKMTYVFNHIFIAEHTTTVSEIRDALEGCYLVNKFCKWKCRKEVRNILNKMHITQMLKIEDRRIIDNQNRISKICNYSNSEERKKSIYKYMSTSSSIDIYNDIWEQSYKDIPIAAVPTTKSFKTAINAIKKNNKGVIPNYYKAIELTQKYTINIK